MGRAVELLAASAVVLLLAGACGGTSDDVAFASPPEVPDQPAPTFAPTTTPAPTFAPTTTAAPEETSAPEVVEPVENVRVEGAPAPTPVPTTGGVHDLIASLPVAPESAAGPYSRHLFGGSWIDADGDGCDTRCEVLRADRHQSLPGLPAGGWLSTYDGYTTDDPSELDIDHLVPLAEAWRSGASGWDGPRRLAFANDLDHPGALVAVTAASNRSKGDKDPAAWQPPSTSAWCDYVMAWVTTKLRWELTADEAEVRALTNMARSQSC
jgi:hypothetical protein